MTTHHYQFGPNVLQTYDVYIPVGNGKKDESAPKYWLVFVHGGYFQGKNVTSTAIQPSIQQLEASYPTLLATRVAGIASLNYRLSNRPGVQDPDTTPPNALQTARWPDHLHDVLEGLRDLSKRHEIHNRYILSGHSVGAQMAFIAALQTLEDSSVPKPAAILGLSGIYDYPLIHRTNPDYIDMTANAMDSKYFGPCSPAQQPASAYGRLGLKALVLAHSRDDGLVNWDQVEYMDALIDTVPELSGKAKVLELEGTHDHIWSGGVQLAKAFAVILEMI
jgi:acetyl esterase/lipase